MSHSLTILIVEDEVEVLNNLIEILNIFASENHDQLKILSATSIKKAKKILKNQYHQIDVVLLDYDLPGKYNGDQVLKYLPKCLNNIFVILVSAFGEEFSKEVEKIVKSMGYKYHYQKKNLETEEWKSLYKNLILEHIKAKQLPYPLARQLEAYNSASPGQKLSTMKDFIETSIKYLIGILAADLTDKTISSDESPLSRGSDFPKSTKRINSVSMLGQWKWELKEWYEQIPDSWPLFVPQIRAILSQPFDLTDSEKKNFLNVVSENQEQSDKQTEDTTESDESALVGFLGKFIDTRNDYLGHPLRSLNDRESSELAKAIEPAFCCFKKRMQILANYPLFIVRDDQSCREDRKIREYTVQTFMGDSQTGKKDTFRSSLILDKHKNDNPEMYLSNGLGDFLPLSPFILLQVIKHKQVIEVEVNGKLQSEEKVCLNEKLCVIDKVKSGKITYKSFDNDKETKNADDFRTLGFLFKKN